MNGVGCRLPALLLVGAVLVAAGCTEEGRDAGRPQATTGARSGSPPVTRSAAYDISCLQADERAAAFRFRVGQRFDTVGVILGEGRNGLVFGHERGSNLCEWVPTARAYARLGYRALVFNFHDQDRLDDDVVAAGRVRPPVAGVVSLSGAAVFADMDARVVVPRLQVPALFMAAKGDRPFPAAARGLYGAAGTRDKQLLVLSSAAHGTNLLSFGREAGKARAALRRFVTAHLDR